MCWSPTAAGWRRCAIATTAAPNGWFSRLGGYWLMGYITVTPRVRRMRDALPGSIIVAAALPVAVKGGAVVMFAIVAALVVTVIRRNDFIAVITGMAVAALAPRHRMCRVARVRKHAGFGPNHARFGASPRTKMICHSVVVKRLVNRSELVFSSS
jgi:uncharacterized membrane protein